MNEQPNLFLLTEAARRTGLSVDALRKRVKWGTLKMVKGNDGLVRIRLTEADMASLPLADGQTPVSQPDERDRTIKALEAEAVLLRELVTKAEQRAGRAETETAAERERHVQSEREREVAKVMAAAMEGEVKGLRKALVEAWRPFWRRWIGP